MNGCVVGIDIGSASSKGIMRRGQEVVASYVMPSGGNYRVTADRVMKELASEAGQSEKDIICTVATGYGAKMVDIADEVMTDITCHSKGLHHLCPSARTIMDVGESYSKVFRTDEAGNVTTFLMNAKCAGGSARVLKVIAKVLRLDIDQLGEFSLKSKNKVVFHTNCAVFAEAEVISRIAEGVAKEDLLAGLHRALAAQLVSLAKRVGIEKDYAITGGGARDIGLVRAVEEISGFDVVVPPEPHLTAALGAAILADQMA